MRRCEFRERAAAAAGWGWYLFSLPIHLTPRSSWVLEPRRLRRRLTRSNIEHLEGRRRQGLCAGVRKICPPSPLRLNGTRPPLEATRAGWPSAPPMAAQGPRRGSLFCSARTVTAYDIGYVLVAEKLSFVISDFLEIKNYCFFTRPFNWQVTPSPAVTPGVFTHGGPLEPATV
jgi:hypothetical protein